MATKAELQDALDKANADRADDDQIVPEGANKGDLEKALKDAGVEFESSDKKGDGALYVVAPIISAITKGNRVLQFYKGDRLPEDITKESLENLQQLGYVSDEPQQ